MVEPLSPVTAIAATPLGAVSLHVHGPAGVTVDVKRVEPPNLPEGMAVDGVMLIEIGTAAPITSELPTLLYLAFDCEGDAETGEWLESMAFRTDEGVLQIAARDPEWLAATDVVAEYAAYKSQGFRQTILEAAAGTKLYISVAWRLGVDAATVDDVSTWFAADLALPA